MLLGNQLIGFGAASAESGGNDAFTKLLLHCDGADASTTFTDSSAGAHTVTVNGNAQVDTAQSKFGGASLLLDGTGDFLNLDGSSDFAFGTGDWTVDFWFRINSAGTAYLFDTENATQSDGATTAAIYISSGKIYYYANLTNRISGTTSLSTGQWYHLAVARSGSSTKMFLDGAQEGSTYTDSINYTVAANRPFLGAAFNTTTFFNGWMEEIRVSKGIARWTSNFTPPTAAYF